MLNVDDVRSRVVDSYNRESCSLIGEHCLARAKYETSIATAAARRYCFASTLSRSTDLRGVVLFFFFFFLIYFGALLLRVFSKKHEVPTSIYSLEINRALREHFEEAPKII